jgi:hypothetical protein
MDFVQLECLSSVDEDSVNILELRLPSATSFAEYIVSGRRRALTFQAVLSERFDLHATGFCCTAHIYGIHLAMQIATMTGTPLWSHRSVTFRQCSITYGSPRRPLTLQYNIQRSLGIPSLKVFPTVGETSRSSVQS